MATLLSGQETEAGAGNATLLERAYYYDAGKEVARDARKAAEYYQQAARQNDGVAQLRLGYLHETGDGVPQDYQTARRLYENAAENGLLEAHFRLAFCHLEGWGGPVDRNAFVRELNIAAEGGYTPAQVTLGGVYFLGYVVPANRELGLIWMGKAAAQDDPLAQYEMGRNVRKAVDLMRENDVSLARGWFGLSAEQEYTAAMNAMALTFMHGNPADNDWQMAKQWLLLSDESGDVEAPYVLGVCAATNPRIPHEDVARAREWFEKAAARNNEKAKDVLDLAARGKSIPDAVRYVLTTPYEERYVQKRIIAEGNSGGDESVRPVPVRVVRPIYPLSLRFAGVEGDVLLQFKVDVTGRVCDPEIVKAAHPLLGERALETIKLWRFRPGRKEGRLVNTLMQVPIQFRLQASEMDGVDDAFDYVRLKAEPLGGQLWDDVQSLSMARPSGRLPVPLIAGNLPPAGSRALLVLVIDSEGRVKRGHIIEAQPEELGPALLEMAKQQRFHPVQIDGVAMEGSVVLPFLKRD